MIVNVGNAATAATAGSVRERLLLRNAVCEKFLNAEADRLALACQQMARRFQDGGRLLAIGRGSYLSDAQHVSVEFVHPVIVGKRALPALDISSLCGGPGPNPIVEPSDMVMGFGGPQGDPEVAGFMRAAQARGAMTLALPGTEGDYFCGAAAADPLVHQEVIEILYHTLWETVHVFLERSELGFDAGESAFLYPFLGQQQPQESAGLVSEVAASIRLKVSDDSALRTRVAAEEADAIVQAVLGIRERLAQGCKLLLFGNGGSATDANDFAFDCVRPPEGLQPVPAISLAQDPANITAIANDVGTEMIFLRQLIAYSRPRDVAVGISTSGGSANVIAALGEARKRGLLTVALLGCDGGEIVRRKLADFAIVVRSDYIPRIQEVQASVYHIVRELLED
ncbi:MAG: SIS domain-containing protein [Bryobacteraceae bacterium]